MSAHFRRLLYSKNEPSVYLQMMPVMPVYHPNNESLWLGEETLCPANTTLEHLATQLKQPNSIQH